jgi:membrane-associated PAP2 superfamily phosphatase
LFLTILIFEFSDLDILIQNYFFKNNSWILDRNNKFLKFVFYDGIKKLIIFFFVLVLLTLLFFYKKPFLKKYKRALIIILLSGILTPSIVGTLKAATNMPCPKNLSYYGANYPHVKLFSKYIDSFHQQKRIRCWPAGHASGGFALMSLILLFNSKKNKVLVFVFVMVISWSIAMYKTLIGDHFFSHSLITMIIAWLVILILSKFIKNPSSKYLSNK